MLVRMLSTTLITCSQCSDYTLLLIFMRLLHCIVGLTAIQFVAGVHRVQMFVCHCRPSRIRMPS